MVEFITATDYILKYFEAISTPSDISGITENVPRDMAGRERNSSAGPSSGTAMSTPGAGFTPEQWTSLVSLIRAVATFTATPAPESPPNREWKAEEVGFFDPSLEDPQDVTIVTVGRHSFYRDVYAFVDRLKDMAKQRPSEKLRTVLPKCFRGDVQM